MDSFQYHMNKASADPTALADLETLKRTFALFHRGEPGGENTAVQTVKKDETVKDETVVENDEDKKKYKEYQQRCRDYHQALELSLSHATFACSDVKNYTRLLLERHRKWVKDEGKQPLDITCTFCNLPHKQNPINLQPQQQQQAPVQRPQLPIPSRRWTPTYSLFSR